MVAVAAASGNGSSVHVVVNVSVFFPFVMHRFCSLVR
jgi:hypothetical protein